MEYIGQGLTPRQYEFYTLEGILPEDRVGESDLFLTRWFDYSLLHPAEATYLYAHYFKLQCRKFYESYIDIQTADNVRGFSPDDIFHSRELTAMWLARRAADRIGCPYPFVMDFAQLRALNRTYLSFPRPNQLYGEEFEIDLKAAWDERLGYSLTYSREERFGAAAYKGTRIQNMHLAFLVGQIKKRPTASHIGLLARMFNEGRLDERMATQDFPTEAIERARALATDLAISQR